MSLWRLLLRIDEINKYQYDRVIVALPIEQAIDICNPLGLEINGVSDSTWVVWGAFG